MDKYPIISCLMLLKTKSLNLKRFNNNIVYFWNDRKKRCKEKNVFFHFINNNTKKFTFDEQK